MHELPNVEFPYLNWSWCETERGDAIALSYIMARGGAEVRHFIEVRQRTPARELLKHRTVVKRGLAVALLVCKARGRGVCVSEARSVQTITIAHEVACLRAPQIRAGSGGSRFRFKLSATTDPTFRRSCPWHRQFSQSDSRLKQIAHDALTGSSEQLKTRAWLARPG
jgi:hypothetical protein